MTRTGRIACSLIGTGACALALGACGGERQDAHEKSATYTVAVTRATFPTSQSLAQPTQMEISVRNDSSQTLPNLAVTVDSFAYRSTQPNLADPQRPTWVVDEGPTGGTTAYTNTWTGGSLAPHQVKTMVWHVTAVAPGVHTVNYIVAAGLNGKAKARTASDQPVHGSFTVDVAQAPRPACVNGKGQVVVIPTSKGTVLTNGDCAVAVK